MVAKKPSVPHALGKNGVALVAAALAAAFLLLCGLSWLFRGDSRTSSGQKSGMISSRQNAKPKPNPKPGDGRVGGAEWLRADGAGAVPHTGGCSMTGTKAGGKGSCADNPDIAPVMEASFNAVQIIKQSLLLEDHLNKEETRCPECMLKHILTMIALAEEAISLADNKEDEKVMQDAAHFYNGVMERIRAKDDECSVAGELRAKRKEMMARYMST